MPTSDPRDRHPRREDEPAPASAVWVKPVLVEYGHLAKLTRGASGTAGEAGGMMVACL
ncbi:MAG TPA: lasso RiPP family leader peptide-containing protein [Vicinamibacterales bacterium]|nr:lasso RiPP family leader peptide-containing protein [Vicinamibacterales bacterium]